jgi:predicted glutamine amidotransferase
MCGLFGFSGPSSYRAASLLQALAIADEVRGRHSTGLALAAREEGSKRLSPRLIKKALSGKEFVRAGWSQILFQAKYPLAIGHNRYATAGEVNDRNAHPFLIHRPHGAALAAHNGLVGGKEAIAERYGVKNVPVDSEVYFRAIGRKAGKSEEDLLDAIEEVTTFIAPRADFACLWLEPAWRSLYFWRSPDRPLAVFDARKLGLGRFLASTVEIFSDAWGSVRGCLPSIKKVETFETRPYSIYRIKDDGVWEVERIRDLKVPDRKAAQASDSCQKKFSWNESQADSTPSEEEEGIRVFLCVGCGARVSEDEAVFADPETGHPSSTGSAHHEDCLPEASASCGGDR